MDSLLPYWTSHLPVAPSSRSRCPLPLKCLLFHNLCTLSCSTLSKPPYSIPSVKTSAFLLRKIGIRQKSKPQVSIELSLRLSSNFLTHNTNLWVSWLQKCMTFGLGWSIFVFYNFLQFIPSSRMSWRKQH